MSLRNKPPCNRAKECFGGDPTGVCEILRSTNFYGEPCPFFKTHKEHKASRAWAKQRLIDIGRSDLLSYALFKSTNKRKIQPKAIENYTEQIEDMLP